MTSNVEIPLECSDTDISERDLVKSIPIGEPNTNDTYDANRLLPLPSRSTDETQQRNELPQQPHQQLIEHMKLTSIDENKTCDGRLADDCLISNTDENSKTDENDTNCCDDSIPHHQKISLFRKSRAKVFSLISVREPYESRSLRLSQIGLPALPKDNYVIGNSINDFNRSFGSSTGVSHNHEEEEHHNDVEHQKGNVFPFKRISNFSKTSKNKNDPDRMKSASPNGELQEQRTTEWQIAKREDLLVRKTKLLVLLVLIIIGVLVSYFVYRYVRHDEKNEYQMQFNASAQLIQNKLQVNALSKLEGINTLAFYIQSYAIQTNQTWPYVTVPNFEDHVFAMKTLTDAFGVQLFPIVTNATRRAWEEYSVQNNDWINASYQTQMGYFGKTNRRPILGQNGSSWFDELWGQQYANPDMPNFDIANGMSNVIFTTVHMDNSSNKDPYIDPDPIGPYFPQWQASPMSWYYQTTVNSNYGKFEDFHNCSMISMRTYEACLGVAWTDNNAPGYITTMLYPIFDRFDYPYSTDLDSSNNKTQQNDEPRNVVAFLGVDIYWASYLKKILSSTTKKLHVVVESTCGDVFTLEMNGEEVNFLGKGDLHESRYDDMYQKTRFGQELYKSALQANTNSDDNQVSSRSSYVGQSLYDDYCQYDFIVYPTSEYENYYNTNRPMIYLITVLLSFIFAIVVFMGYDRLVEQRQKIVLKSAMRSDTILSSLFPKNVKQQLYSEQPEGSETKEKLWKDSSSLIAFTNANKRLSTDTALLTASGVSHQSYNIDEDDDNGTSHQFNGGALLNNKKGFRNVDTNDWQGNNKAIAELHPEATVLFADIVGFTSWCSGREPCDVFLLLETIYGAYDKIAVRRKVFKIETIGDCYVAVTGLPEPQPDHAERMVRFAHEMLAQLVKELKNTITPLLGADSNRLAMRVGLNSGPVIAGVLRGDRARFQLFGDTMNTAARMESNGQPNCIHVSQATADILIAKGKRHWLIDRSDMIEAKGKGKLQTYWVKMRHRPAGRPRKPSSLMGLRGSSATAQLLSSEFSAWSISASRINLDADSKPVNFDYEVQHSLDPTEEEIEEEHEELEGEEERKELEQDSEADKRREVDVQNSISNEYSLRFTQPCDNSLSSIMSHEIVFMKDEARQQNNCEI